MTESQIDSLGGQLTDLSLGDEFHHGDCINADAVAHEFAIEFGYEVIIHPPVNDSKRAFCQGAKMVLPPKPYLARNKDIVRAGEDLLVAAPGEMDEQLRSGTWSTIRYARKRKVPIWLILPDGSIHIEENYRDSLE